MYQATLEDDNEEIAQESLLKKQSQVARILRSSKGKSASRIPYRVRNNIENLIKRYHEVPILNIFSLYCVTYEEILNPEDYGFQNGVLELVGTMCDTLDIFDNGTTLVCRLSSDENRQVDRSISDRWSANLRTTFKNPAFWTSDELAFLEGKRIIIDPPPVATLMGKNQRFASREFLFIFNLLETHPEGIPLLQFGHLYFKKYGRNINLSFFNFSAIADFVNSCPEVFYIEQDDEDKILFDGRYKTHHDLEGKNLKSSQVIKHLTYLINGHILQKTLIIVDNAKPNGLPLNIYLQTLRSNFNLSEKMINYLYELTPMYIVRVMARARLVKLISAPKCANDLRMFINEELDYISWVTDFENNNIILT